MDAERKTTENSGTARIEQEGRERVEGALHAEEDTVNQEAIKEASRLGVGDTYLVEADLEDLDQREDVDQPDGRASPMANADPPER